MIGLDTNILVRYLTKDDEQQWKQAVEIVEGREQCFVANIVLCELIWVLRGKPYDFSKEEIAALEEGGNKVIVGYYIFYVFIYFKQYFLTICLVKHYF